MNEKFRGLSTTLAYALAVSAIFLLSCASPANAQQARARVAFDIPAQPLADALRAVGKRTDTNILIDRKLIGDRQAPALKAQLTTDEALTRLLTGTGLQYRFVDEQTVVVARPDAAEVAMPAAAGASASAAEPAAGGEIASSLRLARAADAEPQTQGVTRDQSTDDKKSKEECKEEAEVTVTGSRIRTLAGQATANPVFVFTSKDFERSGANSLGEFRNMIPQLGVTAGVGGTGLTGGGISFATQARVDLDLRGLGATLILVNGRRMARGGQSIGLDFSNPDGIPLSMIDRLEVLTAGASALYGADAIGGVVNIILKKNFTGSEFLASYDNTFDRDAAVRTLSAKTGYRAGAFSILASATWRDNNEQKMGDRWFTSTAYRGVFASSGLDVTGGPGSISARSGTLPGTGVPVVAIPAGANGATPTVADYQNAGPVPPRFDISSLYSVINPSIRRNAMVRTTYDFSPRFQLYADLNWSEAVTHFTDRPVRVSNLNIPAGYPGNPFGVAVRLSKIFFDLPRSVRESTNRNAGAVAGLQGELGHDWHYDVSGSWARARLLDTYPGNIGASFNTARLTAAMNNPDPTQRPILIYDSTSVTSAQRDLLESLTVNSPFDDISTTYDHSLQVGGPLMRLPAGVVSLATGVEYRLDQVDFPIDPTDPSTLPVAPDRTVRSVFAELQIPLLAEKNAVPMVRQLDLNLAGRIDDHNDFGVARTPRVGLLYRPVKWLALRGSRSQGFKAPLLYSLYAPTSSFIETYDPTFNPLFDPARNEFVEGDVEISMGGNPDLKAEHSVTFNYGAVLDVPFVQGLSVSVDFYDIDYRDKVEDFLSFTPQLLVDSFPGRLTREPSVGGVPGIITALDASSVNTSTTHTRGYDVQVNYEHLTQWGVFGLKAGMNKPERYEYRVTKDEPATQLMFPRRISGALSWSRQAMEASMACIYQTRYRISPTQSYTAPSRIEWTPTIAYDFGQDSRFGNSRGGWISRALADTKITASFPNVFNRSPTVGDAAKSFVTVYDPRLARYILTIRRDF